MSLAAEAAVIADAISWRRQLHARPELAYQERWTSDFIATLLERFGLSVHRGLAGTGLVGTLTRGSNARVIGIRADMDALPIEEKSGAAHASRNAGVMHACGHDGHVAILLGAARVCADLPDLDGTIHFIFQPAEENEGGAKRMVEEGLFQRFPCDSIYALHNWPALPLGNCVVRDGPVMGAFAVFEISILGRGCHGAFPHEGTDAILAGAHLICMLQSIASRSIDPRHTAVVSATQVHAGDTWNAIPDQCVIRGTTRWFTEEVGNTIEQRVREIAISSAAALGCRIELRYERRYPATVNSAEVASGVRSAIARSLSSVKLVDVEPNTGAEDFAFMLQKVPGCYVLLGSGREGENPSLHSPAFDFNDEVVRLGVGLWTSVVRQMLCS